jgi:hypothetical protein
MTYASIESSPAEGRPYFLYQFIEGAQVWRFTSRALGVIRMVARSSAFVAARAIW